MIYTTYEMIRDCRLGKTEGWRYFTECYVPLIRRILAHYFPERGHLAAGAVESVRAGWMDLIEPAPERQFVALLRQKVILDVPVEAAEVTLEIETLGEALAPLTVVEREAVWMETMRYPAADAGRMLRMDPATVEKIRERAAELIRGRVDRWRRTLVEENGPALGRKAADSAGPGCVEVGALLDMIDGRATWAKRREIERHIVECWHCVDHYCRLHEVCDLLRPAEAARI